jgi:hypothetical protein
MLARFSRESHFVLLIDVDDQTDLLPAFEIHSNYTNALDLEGIAYLNVNCEHRLSLAREIVIERGGRQLRQCILVGHRVFRL